MLVILTLSVVEWGGIPAFRLLFLLLSLPVFRLSEFALSHPSPPPKSSPHASYVSDPSSPPNPTSKTIKSSRLIQSASATNVLAFSIYLAREPCNLHAKDCL